MKRNVILLFLGTLILAMGCKKAADAVQGIYNGTAYYDGTDAGSAHATISMVSDNVVNMNFTVTGDTVIDYLSVAVAGVENPYSLSYHTGKGNMYGQVSNNDLTFTFYDTSGTQISFSGSK